MAILPHASGVYKLTCTPTGKFYIGSAEDLAIRCDVHIKRLRTHKHENQYLQHAWDKYGANAFHFEVIELVLSTFRLEREQYWLDKLRPYDRKRGFNISLQAGAPMAGRKHTPDSLAKIARSQIGRKHTEETKRMMSERNKGKVFGVHTEESRRKMAETNRGRKHSPETIQKMRASGRNRTDSGHAYIVTTPDGESLTIVNLARFCRENGLSDACMQAVSVGRNKSHKGWKCQRL